jgi:hypothetical protein
VHFQKPGLTIVPPASNIETNGEIKFFTDWGVEPYTYEIENGTGSIDKETGLYKAPVATGIEKVKVIDSVGVVSYATLRVVDKVTIAPKDPVISVNKTVQFSVSGGDGPYTFKKVSGVGEFNPTTGLYKAPDIMGDADIEVKDSNGFTSTTTVHVIVGITIVDKDIQLAPGKSRRIAVSGGVTGQGFPKWEITSGEGTIDQNGVFKAAMANGTTHVKVTDAAGTYDEVDVITYSNLSISPKKIILAKGSKYKFTIRGGARSKEGTLSVSATSGGLVEGLASVETVKEVIEFTAPNQNVQDLKITITDSSGMVDEALVQVTDQLALAQSTLKMSVGNMVLLKPVGGTPPFKFTVNSGEGTVTQEGRYMAPNSPGEYIVTISDSTPENPLTVTGNMIVEPALRINPNPMSVMIGTSTVISMEGGVGPTYSYELKSGSGKIVESLNANAKRVDYKYEAPAELPLTDTEVVVTDSCMDCVDSTSLENKRNSYTFKIKHLGLLALNNDKKIIETQTTLPFSASGGIKIGNQGPNCTYNYFLISGVGSIDKCTGLYSSGNITGTATIRAVDGAIPSNKKDSTITVVAGFTVSPDNFSIGRGESRSILVSGGLTKKNANNIESYLIGLQNLKSLITGGTISEPTLSGSSVIYTYIAPVNEGFGKADISIKDYFDPPHEKIISVTVEDKSFTITPSNPFISPGASLNFTLRGGNPPRVGVLENAVAGDNKFGAGENPFGTFVLQGEEGPTESTFTYTAPAVSGSVRLKFSGVSTLIQITPALQVTSVSTTKADGAYPAGTLIPITVKYSDAVFLKDTNGNMVNDFSKIQLTLNINGATGLPVPASGITANSITFNYVVQAGHNVALLDALNTNSLVLAAGFKITDGVGTPVSLSLPDPKDPAALSKTLGGSSKIEIDTIAPAAPTSISFVDPVGSAPPAGSDSKLKFVAAGADSTPTVKVSGGGVAKDIEVAVYIQGILDVNLCSVDKFGGSTKAAADSVDLTLAPLKTTGGKLLYFQLKDKAGNVSPCTKDSSNYLRYDLQSVPPYITSVGSPDASGTVFSASANSTAKKDIYIDLNFNTLIDVTGSPQLDLSINGETKQATFVSANATVMTFKYTVQPTDAKKNPDSFVNVASLNGLKVNGGSIFKLGSGGVNAELQLPKLDSTQSLISKQFKVDTLAPSVPSLVSSSVVSSKINLLVKQVQAGDLIEVYKDTCASDAIMAQEVPAGMTQVTIVLSSAIPNANPYTFVVKARDAGYNYSECSTAYKYTPAP